MKLEYWYKQTPDQPLFPELEWSRPENKAYAGKLLIIGGNAHGFAAPAQAFQTALSAGAGSVRVLIPSAIQKLVGGFLPEAMFAPSTPSGSFAQASLDEWLLQSEWADAVLIPGDIGKNSETAVVLENYLLKFNGPFTVTKDAVDAFTSNPSALFDRSNTTLVCTFSQLQKLLIGLKYRTALTSDMDLLQLVRVLHELTSTYSANILVRHSDYSVVAVRGDVSTTPITQKGPWSIQTATSASVWAMQHPSKTFESLTSSLFYL